MFTARYELNLKIQFRLTFVLKHHSSVLFTCIFIPFLSEGRAGEARAPSKNVMFFLPPQIKVSLTSPMLFPLFYYTLLLTLRFKGLMDEMIKMEMRSEHNKRKNETRIWISKMP